MTRIRTRTQRLAAPSAPAYLDLIVADAAPRLGLSVDALWARLRRTPPDATGMVPLGGGVVGYRFGARAWRVRFPVDPAA
jgi:hypothetical protein